MRSLLRDEKLCFETNVVISTFEINESSLVALRLSSRFLQNEREDDYYGNERKQSQLLASEYRMNDRHDDGQ